MEKIEFLKENEDFLCDEWCEKINEKLTIIL